MNLVKHILEGTRQRLAVLEKDASVSRAAEILTNPDTPLAVVCDGEGVVVGVVSSMDIVKAIGRANGNAMNLNAEMIMTTSVFACDADQSLESVWAAMSARNLRCAPVLDSSGRPEGVLHARDLVLALLDEVTHEEILLRDYVLGIGYQ